MSHHAHPDVIKRLKRANGHLETIIEMIEEGRPHAQLAQQLEAVERAVENAKKALIQDYIAQVLERAALRQLKTIAKYL
jgi:DNA-binding FrmR family transcriptional regulator